MAKLFISGQGAYDPSHRLSPTAVKIKEILDASEDGELFTTKQIANMVKVALNTIAKINHTLLEYQYSVKYSEKYWGKPATVAQLKRETEHEGHRSRRAGAGKSTGGC